MVVTLPMQAFEKALWTRPQKQALLSSCQKHLLHTLLAVMAYFCIMSALAHEARAADSNNSTPGGRHEGRAVFDWRDTPTQSSPYDTSQPNLSLYHPAQTDYGQWNTLDRDDRKVALAEIAADIIGYSFKATSIGRGILALREPIQGSGKDVHCSQRFTLKRYFLRCGLKF